LKKIVIVGGGTAGWLTALHIKSLYNSDADIILIESEDIGILGAGEGSVPNLVEFLGKLNISEDEFLKETHGTHKIGIHFENWNNDGKNYMHDFFSTDTMINPTARHEYFGYMFKNNLDINEYMLSKHMAYNSYSPISNENKEIISYSLHFDAHLVAKYLRKVAEERGIIRIEDNIIGFQQNQFGDVNGIQLKNNESIKDIHFVFDCSGFARLVIGKLYNTEWISYKDKLTVNSALPFQLPQSKDNINPYTKAIAMDYGWIWQIPLQNRWGCGYVFDKNYISDAEAKVEVENYIGSSIQFGKVINFEAGRYKTTWINNCMAIGLSAGFVEPLEATAIGMVVSSLKFIKRFDIDYKNYHKISSYNLISGAYSDDIVDFLQFHYMTKRNHNDFWKFYNNESNISNKLINNLNSLKTNLYCKLPNSIFSIESYTMIGIGLGHFNKNLFIEKYEFEKANKQPDLDEFYNRLREARLKIKEYLIKELDYLNNIK
jgi:tryptophan halogenase